MTDNAFNKTLRYGSEILGIYSTGAFTYLLFHNVYLGTIVSLLTGGVVVYSGRKLSRIR